MPAKLRQISPAKKAAQHARTRANKIKKCGRMLMQNPGNEQVKNRLAFWEGNTK